MRDKGGTSAEGWALRVLLRTDEVGRALLPGPLVEILPLVPARGGLPSERRPFQSVPHEARAGGAADIAAKSRAFGGVERGRLYVPRDGCGVPGRGHYSQCRTTIEQASLPRAPQLVALDAGDATICETDAARQEDCQTVGRLLRHCWRNHCWRNRGERPAPLGI